MDVANIGVRAQVGAVAMLLRRGQYTGTCFPFRRRHIFLTARHCVGDATADELTVHSQGGRKFRILEINCHQSADVAAVIGDASEGGIPYPFTGLAMGYDIGDPFVSFGFPVGATYADAPDQPTPRIFRGYTQRMADFSSGGSEPYRAFELSIPASEGLSGGPVFVPGSDRVFGVVTANLESYTTRVAEEVRTSSTETHRIESRRIITYGMALSLWGVEDWLKIAAPLSGDLRW